jgi:predicted Zn-dependent protease with MMP-like domain
MDTDAFAELVEEALDSLPDVFLEKLENIEVAIEAWPSRQDLSDAGLDPRNKYGLLGLYHGVPLTDRHVEYTAWPDLITIYQRPIEAVAGNDPEAIRVQVQRTVVHEIAHYYGITDDRLDELGWG